MQLPPILSVMGAASFTLTLAHPFAPFIPFAPSTPTIPAPNRPLPPVPPHAPLPSSLVPMDSKITGNFSHSCDQITLMNNYFLAATCSPVHTLTSLPGSGSGSGSGEGEGEGDGEGDRQKEEGPEFNQLDLNMCIGFDQGSTTAGGTTGRGPEGGNYGGNEGRLIWQALGKYANYCGDCKLTTGAGPAGSTHELKCSCAPMTGEGAVETVLDLDEGVENRNGTLVCRGGMGSGIGPGPLPPPIED
ncbi:hypothetical protein B0T20DRAFT_146557 [Sordaria brevicollis]|uniref:Cyanovirin-N domain-containing protein n=1 Tax=Sordaria brevicollis TaxID=83679 RepID=A0AAE0PIJ4_SORBR|nr:hypothetical protein B0T20DRAFT_146557 [Sordaria brevicollis]